MKCTVILLIMSSCFQPLSEQDFVEAITRVVRDAKRDIRLIEQRGQSADHPILASMPETRYLKCFIVQVL